MTKRLQPILVIAIALLVPSLVFAAANKCEMSLVSAENGKVVVSMEASNAVPLAGIDIPLRYSEGVTLEKVTFDGTRVEYFDFKAANINHDERTVVIGLLPQFSAEAKADLEVNDNPGTICRLHFTVNDESVSKIKIEAIETKDPNHTLTYIYRDGNVVKGVSPEFSGETVSLTKLGELPQAYALRQNYPNPFNPKCKVAFDMPNGEHARLVVFNVLGQKVNTLVDEYREAGTHIVEFDGASLSSGVYFYRLETQSGYTKTNKMMLLK